MEDNRIYYKTWEEAERHRIIGQRMYLNPTRGYYIVTPKKREFWNII